MKTYTVKMKWSELVGPAESLFYNDMSPALRVGTEIVSINLGQYNLTPPEGHVYVKDWSEHEGLTDALVEAGLVEKVSRVTVGPFNSPAYLVRVVGETYSRRPQA